MRYEVVYAGHVTTLDRERQNPEELARILDAVMDELVNHKAEDPAIGAKGSDASVEISVSVQASDPGEAVELGSGIIRAAIHAAGGFTPSWSFDWLEARAILVDELVEA